MAAPTPPTSAYRFGIRLSWPIQNAAIFTLKLTVDQAGQVSNAVKSIKSVLLAIGQVDYAGLLVFEAKV